MSEPQSSRGDRLNASRHSELGELVIIVLVLSLLVDGLGWLAGGGFFRLIAEIQRASSGVGHVEIGDNSLLSIAMLISFLATREIAVSLGWTSRIMAWRARQGAIFVVIFLALFFSSRNLFDLTFNSLDYQRCEQERSVGSGKFRFRLIRYVREPANCPKPDPLAALPAYQPEAA